MIKEEQKQKLKKQHEKLKQENKEKLKEFVIEYIRENRIGLVQLTPMDIENIYDLFMEEKNERKN